MPQVPAALSPLAEDDDDIRWAISTALVQWQRGGPAEAIVWIERAAEAASSAGLVHRAQQLRLEAHQLARAATDDGIEELSDDDLEEDDLDIDVDIDIESGRPASLRAIVSPPQLKELGLEAAMTDVHGSAPEDAPMQELLGQVSLPPVPVPPPPAPQNAAVFQTDSPRARATFAPEANFNDPLSSIDEVPFLAEEMVVVGQSLEASARHESRNIDRLSEPTVVAGQGYVSAMEAQALALEQPRLELEFPEESPEVLDQVGPHSDYPISSRRGGGILGAVSVLPDSMGADEERPTGEFNPTHSRPPASGGYAANGNSLPPLSDGFVMGRQSLPPLDNDFVDSGQLPDRYRDSVVEMDEELELEPVELEPVSAETLEEVEQAEGLDSERLEPEPLSSELEFVPLAPASDHYEGAEVGAEEQEEFDADQKEEPPAAEDRISFQGVLSLPVPAVDVGSDAENSPPTALTAAQGAGQPDAREAVEALPTTQVDGVDLSGAPGFEDLPEEVQQRLAATARLEALNHGEEVGLFGAAVITHGQVHVLPVFADEVGTAAVEGSVVFTKGSQEPCMDLRVIAKLDGTRVAVWDAEQLEEALADCPWVEDELRFIADRFLALCGATLGPLGERLDPSLREVVFQRLEVRALDAGENLTEAGAPLEGLYVLTGGSLSQLEGEEPGEKFSPGDILFAGAIMGGQPAPATVEAGESGALLLFAPRSVAHELMVMVPPLLEVLAG